MAAYRAGWITYGHLQADCLYTGISSGPNARYRAWAAVVYLLSLEAASSSKASDRKVEG